MFLSYLVWKYALPAFPYPFSRDTFRGIAGLWLGVFLQSKGATAQIPCRHCWDKGGMCSTKRELERVVREGFSTLLDVILYNSQVVAAVVTWKHCVCCSPSGLSEPDRLSKGLYDWGWEKEMQSKKKKETRKAENHRPQVSVVTLTLHRSVTFACQRKADNEGLNHDNTL